MKKQLLLTSVLFAVAITVSAQFKVLSDGKITIGTTVQPLSDISINSNGAASFYNSYKGDKSGLYVSTYTGCDQYNWGYSGYFTHFVTSTDASFIVGVRGVARPQNFQTTFNWGRSYGVMGVAAGFTSGYNYGVFGRIDGTQNGAGVYGTSTNDSNGAEVNGRYAGYFAGNVNVTGNLSVQGSINGVIIQGAKGNDERSIEPAELADGKSSQSIADRLSALNAIIYRMPTAENTRNTTTEQSDTAVTQEPLSLIEQQVREKQHFGISVDRLAEVFPELVYDLEDGSRAINYMEMIPLLVQSINDLKAEIVILSNSGSRKAPNTASTPSITSNAAVLLQNSPNPFTERTTIRFTLPENANNAYIYVFDMTGKMQKQVPVDASMQSITINGYELSAGMYIYSLVVDGKEMDTKRMILSK